MKLALALIEENGGTQSRAALNAEKITEYSEVLESLPPIVVFYDGTKYWLGDGFHRVAAAVNIEAKEIEADVRQGTLRDAIFFSFSANASHGIPRSIADKRRAVERMLADAEWSTWSDRRIADACRVSHPFVAGIRRPKAEPSGNVATSQSGIQSVRGNVSNPHTGSNPVGPAIPAPVESRVTARAAAADEDLRRAGELETRLVSVTEAICDASLRVRQYMGAELDRSLQRLHRARTESAA
jgi:hypothetical protein